MAYFKLIDTTETSSKFRTNLVRFSYAQVFVPKAYTEGADEKYSVNILIPKSDTQLINAINTEIKRLKELHKNGLLKGTGLVLPLRDGDTDKEGDPVYAGHYYINAKSNIKPQIIDRQSNVLTTDEEFYSGCYGVATFNLYVIKKGVKGIAAGLGNIIKLKEGERLSGGGSAVAEFNDMEFDDFEDDDDLDNL